MKLLKTANTSALALSISIIAPIALALQNNESNNIDFGHADQLFSQRVEGEDKVLAAQDEYRKLFSQARGEDRLYAASQVARLSYYHGEVLTSRSEKDKRVSIFKKCADDIDQVNPENYGQETEAYYNWKLTCVTLWMESGKGISGHSPSFKLAANDLKRLIKKSLQFTSNEDGEYVGTYEGGAIARYVSAIYSNPSARAIGLYKPAEALTLIRAAQSSDYHDSRAYPEPLSGEDYAENSFVMVKVLRENRMQQDADSYLAEAIEDLEDLQDSDELPIGRETEAQHQLERLKSL